MVVERDDSLLLENPKVCIQARKVLVAVCVPSEKLFDLIDSRQSDMMAK